MRLLLIKALSMVQDRRTEQSPGADWPRDIKPLLTLKCGKGPLLESTSRDFTVSGFQSFSSTLQRGPMIQVICSVCLAYIHECCVKACNSGICRPCCFSIQCIECRLTVDRRAQLLCLDCHSSSQPRLKPLKEVAFSNTVFLKVLEPKQIRSFVRCNGLINELARLLVSLRLGGVLGILCVDN